MALTDAPTPPPPATHQPRDPTPHAQTPRRGLLAAAVTLFGLWCAALAFLAATTANPPLINLRQLAQARFLVTAVVEDTASGSCRVLERWSPGEIPDRIRVTNLSATGAVAGREYILPLRPDPVADDGAFRVADLPLRGFPPLIYPRTPEVERQLRAWQRPQP